MKSNRSVSLLTSVLLLISLTLGRSDTFRNANADSPKTKACPPFTCNSGNILQSIGYGGNSEILKEDGIDTKSIVDFSLDENYDGWRDSLPPQLQQRRGSLHRILVPTGFTRIKNQNDRGGIDNSSEETENINCEIYLLGTAHVSKDSCEDVKLLMEKIKPDVLFVELCVARIGILTDEEAEEKVAKQKDDKSENEVKQSVSQLTKEIMDHNPDMSRSAALSSVLLTKIQGDYATKLGVKIGGEFQEAYKMAKRQQDNYRQYLQRLRWEQQYGQSMQWNNSGNEVVMNGCALVLGDRPVRLTLLRTWESLSFFGKVKLFFALIISSFRQPDENELKEWIESIMNDPSNDILSKSIQELSRHFPSVKETIIAERDVYMSCKIIQTARLLGSASANDGKTRRILVVVGAGHCPGICKSLAEYCNKDVKAILRSVIETKNHKVEGDQEMSLLITDVASLDI
mmetsp:Transcript_9287/g.11733  ORF Transcript_9287/g.11733 Transcript_9287/m.11733 type:complete len:458 (+) Transcript_9287:68-1441(+)